MMSCLILRGFLKIFVPQEILHLPSVSSTFTQHVFLLTSNFFSQILFINTYQMESHPFQISCIITSKILLDSPNGQRKCETPWKPVQHWVSTSMESPPPFPIFHMATRVVPSATRHCMPSHLRLFEPEPRVKKPEKSLVEMIEMTP